MLFNSIEFILFLPLVFLLYWTLFSKKHKWQNCFILLASYIFYGWWDFRFLGIIIGVSALSFISGLLIERFRDKQRFGKSIGYYINLVNILCNLSILGIFKYYNFFIDNLIELLDLIGLSFQVKTLNIILPIGISFYIFQSLSYTIDVYRGKMKPTKDLIAYFVYVAFFPQLVAGPIERASHLLPQFLSPRKFSYPLATDGLRQMLWGFFKKVVIADNIAISVDHLFENYTSMPASSLWLGSFLFSIQIYGDFSGYSDIGIGAARLLGFNLNQNFNFPYFSRNMAEFWRKWHISLTTWLRDYIYYPLGGSRCSITRNALNISIIFIISGIWHGANWTFLFWGVFHTCLYLPLLFTGANKKAINPIAFNRYIPSIKEVAQMLLTFTIASIGRVIFRSENLHQVAGYFHGMIDLNTIFNNPIPDLFGYKSPIILALIMLIIEWFNRTKKHGFDIQFQSKTGQFALYYSIIILLYLYGGHKVSFIYFQF